MTTRLVKRRYTSVNDILVAPQRANETRQLHDMIGFVPASDSQASEQSGTGSRRKQRALPLRTGNSRRAALCTDLADAMCRIQRRMPTVRIILLVLGGGECIAAVTDATELSDVVVMKSFKSSKSPMKQYVL